MKRIIFQTGGPWHPVEAQAALIRKWLLDGWELETASGNDALDRLDDADLYVAGGMFWPELDRPQPPEAWAQAGEPPQPYVRPSEKQRAAFRAYVASGRPVLAFHGGILCYEDWPEYGQLLGFRWHWGYTGHSVYARYPIRVAADSHPVVAGVTDFEVHDELYFNVVLPPLMPTQVHAKAHYGEWVDFPMVLTAEGEAGRVAGAGRTAYLANGHSMQSLEPPQIRRLWLNTLEWLLEA